MADANNSGGPTVEQRRQFSNLPPGSHVPGYMGYLPQFKYRCGKTFGKETHALSKDTVHLEPKSAMLDVGDLPTGQVTDGGVPLSLLPKSTGDNKYMEGMIPGYSGYIPKRLYKFGATYRHECDDCVSDLVGSYSADARKRGELADTARATPRLDAQRYDPFIKEELNNWIDRRQRESTLIESHRTFTEPPIPHYKGFIPRFYSTDSGLGSTFHYGTGRSFDRFVRETQTHRSAITPTDPEAFGPGSFVETVKTERAASTENLYGPGDSRLYVKSGMIPRYTGYIPQKRYMFGRTYGDGTRGLPACRHDETNYGTFVRKSETLSTSN